VKRKCEDPSISSKATASSNRAPAPPHTRQNVNASQGTYPARAPPPNSAGFTPPLTCVAVFIKQLRNALALLLAECRDKALPKTLLSTVSDAADKAFEDTHARQQHLVDDQPEYGALDQRAGMIVASPAQCIKPSRQTKAGRPVLGKFREAVALADKGDMQGNRVKES